MTTVDRQVPAQPSAGPRAPVSGIGSEGDVSLWQRILRAIIPGRRAAVERHEQMLARAKQNPPPQKWFDEDPAALRTPPKR